MRGFDTVFMRLVRWLLKLLHVSHQRVPVV
jgi:hypothetical protein